MGTEWSSRATVFCCAPQTPDPLNLVFQSLESKAQRRVLEDPKKDSEHPSCWQGRREGECPQGLREGTVTPRPRNRPGHIPKLPQAYNCTVSFVCKACSPVSRGMSLYCVSPWPLHACHTDPPPMHTHRREPMEVMTQGLTFTRRE